MSRCPPICIFTHSDYHNIFLIALRRFEKFAPSFQIIIFTNHIIQNIDIKYIQIQYNDADVYTKKMLSCLSLLDYEYIIFIHDNNALYDFVNEIQIIQYIECMKTYHIDQLRLNKNGVGNTPYNEVCNTIYDISTINSYIYSVQPAIWKLSSLIDILDKNTYNYRDIELNIDKHMLSYKNCFYYNNEDTFINTGRHKSNLFPTIHLTYYGKWLYSENVPYIDYLFKEFSINKDTIEWV